jgi:hypothetical protein
MSQGEWREQGFDMSVQQRGAVPLQPQFPCHLARWPCAIRWNKEMGGSTGRGANPACHAHGPHTTQALAQVAACSWCAYQWVVRQGLGMLL